MKSAKNPNRRRTFVAEDASARLFLIMPREHGNDGWCGSTVLTHVTPKWMLRRDPVKTYLRGHYEPMFGSQLRLCKTKDPNDAAYLYDHEERKWLDKRGRTLPQLHNLNGG